MKKPVIKCRHQRQDKPDKADKLPTRTAQALDMVLAGATVAQAALAFGVRRQSIYRLQKYRAQRVQCPTCGTVYQAKK